jgi:hypothetical protein
MSILNEIPQHDIDQAEKKAVRVKYLTKAIADQIIKTWNEGWDLIWNDENPQLVLDALGEDAGEVFELNTVTMMYLAEILGGRKQSELDKILLKVAQKPPTEVDENGNVSIN